MSARDAKASQIESRENAAHEGNTMHPPGEVDIESRMATLEAKLLHNAEQNSSANTPSTSAQVCDQKMEARLAAFESQMAERMELMVHRVIDERMKPLLDRAVDRFTQILDQRLQGLSQSQALSQGPLLQSPSLPYVQEFVQEVRSQELPQEQALQAAAASGSYAPGPCTFSYAPAQWYGYQTGQQELLPAQGRATIVAPASYALNRTAPQFYPQQYNHSALQKGASAPSAGYAHPSYSIPHNTDPRTAGTLARSHDPRQSAPAPGTGIADTAAHL
jgi:hypothetical protein